MSIKLNAEIISILVLCVTIVIASQIMLTPYSNYKNFFQQINGVPFSNIDLDEYNASTYFHHLINLKQNPNAYVISDYGTSYIVRGMTGMNTSASRHPAMNMNNWKMMQVDIKKLFSQKLDHRTSITLNKIAKEVEASNVYLVISKRTCWWLDQKSVEIIRYLPLPKDYTYEAYCAYIANKFDSSSSFSPVYKNSGIRVYEYLQNR